jgi:Spy/CpxP family protein refolding chaperone
MRRFVFCTVGMLLVSAGVLMWWEVWAQETPPGRWWHMPKVGVNLTIAEQKYLDDLFAQNRLRLIDLEAAFEKERFGLENVMDKEPLNEAAVMAQFRRMEQARTEMGAERFKFLVQVRKLLGYDRYQKLKAMFHEFREKHHHRKKFSDNDYKEKGDDRSGHYGDDSK